MYCTCTRWAGLREVELCWWGGDEEAEGEGEDAPHGGRRVVMNSSMPRLERDIAVLQAIGSIDVPVDVFTRTPQEFEETKDIIGGIAYAPAKYGRIVYEKS
jgi:hypothetical protein